LDSAEFSFSAESHIHGCVAQKDEVAEGLFSGEFYQNEVRSSRKVFDIQAEQYTN